VTLDNGTDGQTDGQTDRQSATQYAAPPREEGRIIMAFRLKAIINNTTGKKIPSGFLLGMANIRFITARRRYA